jgi:hypothetical protein
MVMNRQAVVIAAKLTTLPGSNHAVTKVFPVPRASVSRIPDPEVVATLKPRHGDEIAMLELEAMI